MSRNFGVGSRDMVSAVRIGLRRAVDNGEISFSAAETVLDRFRVVSEREMRPRGIRRLENITPELLIEIGRGFADSVDDGDMSASYAQNLISSVNTAMKKVGNEGWRVVSPTKECSIPSRSQVRKSPPTGMDGLQFHEAISNAMGKRLGRGTVIAELARGFGLRAKEASLLNARAALNSAELEGVVFIESGTKGGRPRKVPVTSSEQIDVLRRAAGIQGSDKSMIPAGQTWAEFREGEVRRIRELLQLHGISRLHELRAVYACNRYQQLSGHLPPLLGGKAARELDIKVRLEVAEELGHGRIDVTNAYLGGRRNGNCARS